MLIYLQFYSLFLAVIPNYLLSEPSFFEIKVYGTDNVKIYFKHLLKIMSNDYL